MYGFNIGHYFGWKQRSISRWCVQVSASNEAFLISYIPRTLLTYIPFYGILWESKVKLLSKVLWNILPCQKTKKKTAELQRRLQFKENGVDYGVSSIDLKIILYIPCGPSLIEQTGSSLASVSAIFLKKTNKSSVVFSALYRPYVGTEILLIWTFFQETWRKPSVAGSQQLHDWQTRWYVYD